MKNNKSTYIFPRMLIVPLRTKSRMLAGSEIRELKRYKSSGDPTITDSEEIL